MSWSTNGVRSERNIEKQINSTSMLNVDNEIITIAGYEVDTTVNSHEIHPDIMKIVSKDLKTSNTKIALAKKYGVHRKVIDSFAAGSCHPDSYKKLLTKLFNDNKIPA